MVECKWFQQLIKEDEYMKLTRIMSIFLTLMLAVSALVGPIGQASAQESESVVKLRIMETTDIHVNLMNYDYYQDKETNKFGLVKTAELIKEARAEVKNSLLFDNGDLIQGNPLGDYVAKIDPLKEGEIHPVFKVMNLINYDAGNVGNHEFNYGLEFLKNSLAGSEHPYVSANVYIDDKDGNPDNDQNYFTPYLILDREVVDENGKTQTLKVGVIGFVPPQIMLWDKAHLEGKVIAKDIVETAKKFVPQMKAEGADIIVAIPHSGIGTMTQDGMEENATYDLSLVEGIDAILFGHSHSTFPSDKYSDVPGADIEKGTLNGVAAVMPGYWGSHLGVVDLTLEMKDGKWAITNSQSEARGIRDADGNPLVERDEDLVHAIHDEHEHTLEYIRGPVGETTAPINSYFSQVQDDPSVQIVSNAQKWYVENYIQGTEYDGLPVLSAAAPFKAGTRSNPDYYTDVPAGTIAVKNVSDLYLYPNTLRAVLVTGAEVKEWLEMSAGQFNQINPSSKEEQALVNPNFRSYNFDVIDGVTYQVDVTKPARYSEKGALVNPDSHRIVNLQFEGKAIDADQKFIVATNNYRASGGGNFPGLTGDNVIIESPDENRQIIINYIMEKQTINPAADNNWSFAPLYQSANVVFESSTNAQKYTENADHLSYIETLESGFAKYSIEFPVNTDGVKKVQILHTNDSHARVEEGKYDGMGFAKLSTLVKQYKAQNANTLLLDAGDTFHGTTFATLVKGSSIVDVLNQVGYDGMAAGNHDFNYGYERLLELSAMADFPVLSANVVKEDGSLLLPPSMITEVDGIKIGIFGLSTPETHYKTHPKNVEGLTFTDPVAAAKEQVEKLKAENVDMIIAVTHLGIDESSTDTSIKVAEGAPGIDLIVDGHSHTTLVEGLQGENDTLIVSSGEYTKNLGVVELVFVDNKLVNKTAELITKEQAKNIEPDADVQAVIDAIKVAQEEVLAEVIGKTTVNLDGEREIVRMGESNLGNLITDAMLKVSGAEVAITNGGGIRASVEAGDITKGDIITVLPFGNYIVTKEVSGADIKAALENGASGYPATHGAFSHVAGMTYKIDPSKPAGERVYDVKVDGKPLNVEKTYVLATNDFMAAGGDKYTMFADDTIKNEFPALDEAVISYIKAEGEISPKTENRVVIEEQKVVKPETPAKPEVTTYVVKSGDNLSKIAQQYKMKWQEIFKANKGMIKNPNLIYPGQKLVIPQK